MRNAATKIYRKSLLAFIEKAFRSLNGDRLNNSQRYIAFIAYKLEQLLQGDIKNLLINLPGRHLKTFICSVCFPAFALGLDPTLKFMIVAYNEDVAEDIVRQIREIMESAWYRSVFDTRISVGHSLKSDFSLKGGGRVRAVAIRSVTGKGGDIIIFDDPHNVHDWNNERRKEKVIEAFEVLTSRRDGGAMSRMVVVGHRVAEDDVSAHILNRGTFEHVCLPLFAPKAMTFDMGEEQLQLPKGTALRPDAYPPEEIESIQQNHRGSPFWLHFQQGLGPKTDNFKIDSSHFHFSKIKLGDIRASAFPVVLSVDPTQGTNSSSRNVVHVYAVLGNNYLLFQVFAEKCSFDRLCRQIKRLATKNFASVILVENTARGPDLIEELESSLPMPIYPVNPHGSKGDRFRKCIPIIRAKRVSIISDPLVEEAVDEIVAYPNAAYDDNLDAMTNFLLRVPKLDLRLRTATARSNMMGIALASGRSIRNSSVEGAAIARARSVFWCHRSATRLLKWPSRSTTDLRWQIAV